MRQVEEKEKKARFVRLPRISPAARLILFVGIFLVIAIPLFLIFSQQPARQAELNQQYSILQKAVGNQEPPEIIKKDAEYEITKAQNQLAAIRAAFPDSDQIAEIIDGLINLAKENGVEITKTQVVNSRSSISIGTDVLEYPTVVFDINLRGQVPKFQNFLLALNSKFPASELKKVDFKIPESKDLEDTANIVLSEDLEPSEDLEHTANIVLNVYCSEIPKAAAGEIPIAGKNAIITFTDKTDKTTDLFNIKGSKWRIDWKIVASDSKWADFSVIVYRKGEIGRYVEIISHIDGSTEGTDYVYKGEGDYYIKVVTANISNWEIKIYE